MRNRTVMSQQIKSDPSAARGHELRGRTVFCMLVAFFGVVFAVNAIMVYAATSTFGGVETESSYKAGLAFKSELTAARVQDALGWQVSGKVTRDAQRQAEIEVTVQGSAAWSPLLAQAHFAHPTDARLDRTVLVRPDASGTLRGRADVPPGQWDLLVDLYHGSERVFRSKNRIVLR